MSEPNEFDQLLVHLPKQPPIEWYTGAWNGPLIRLDADDPFGHMERLFSPGIHITSITPPEQGWPIAMYCPICKTTTFILSLWAEKPTDCDYIRVNEICVSDEHSAAHNIEFTFRDRGLSFAHSTRFKVKP